MQELKRDLTTKARDQTIEKQRRTIIMNYLLLNWKKMEGTIVDLQQSIRTT